MRIYAQLFQHENVYAFDRISNLWNKTSMVFDMHKYFGIMISLKCDDSVCIYNNEIYNRINFNDDPELTLFACYTAVVCVYA